MIGNALRRVRRSSAAIALSMSVMPVAIAAAETADEFVARLNRELAATALELNAAAWTQATYITVDTQFLTAKANERLLADFSRLVAESKAFDGKPMSPASRRTIELLKLGLPAPAPDDPAKRAELAAILAGMEAKYGSAKYCPKGSDGCRDETELKAVIAASRNYDELLDAWQGWHDAARPLRADYARFVTLANEGARELGYKDLGAMWRAGYDMPADDFTKEAARLWGQVQPFYEQLHCYTRARLAKKYGEDRVPAGKPIPAHLLGNMWAQEWDSAYDLLEPYPGVNNLDVDSALKAQGYDATRMAKSAEAFYDVDRVPRAAADLLGTLDAREAARPGRGLPRQRLAARRLRRRAHQDVHRSPPMTACAPSTTRWGTSITTSGTRTSRSCSRAARTMVSTRPSATR